MGSVTRSPRVLVPIGLSVVFAALFFPVVCRKEERGGRGEAHVEYFRGCLD